MRQQEFQKNQYQVGGFVQDDDLASLMPEENKCDEAISDGKKVSNFFTGLNKVDNDGGSSFLDNMDGDEADPAMN